MKDIRPSTWAILVVLLLMIFVPPLFIDEEMFANAPEDLGPIEHNVAPPPGREESRRPANRPAANTDSDDSADGDTPRD